MNTFNARLAKTWQIVMPAFFTLRYKKLFLFAEAFKNTRKFKTSIERINLHLILHLLAFVEIRLFLNVFFWERRAGFKTCGMRDAGFSRKRGGNAGSRPSLPDPALCDDDATNLDKENGIVIISRLDYLDEM